MTQKWNLQDIRPVSSRPRRTIDERPSTHTERPRLQRDMKRPLTPPARGQAHAPATDAEPGPEFDTLPTVDVYDGNKRTRKNLFLVGGFITLALVGAFGISIATGGAEITLYPKVRELNVNAEFTAFKEKQPGELSYEVLTIEQTAERQVAASGQEEVTTQATGEIEISKATAGAERLIKNTRFATSDGKVFRIQESVVVPGAVQNSSGELVPGVIRAQVFADEAGDTYNIPANTTFTVPGFSESGLTDLFAAVTARSTGAFTGGFSGPKFIIDDAALATARQELQQQLRDELLQKITESQPAGFTVFSDSIAITYTQLPAIQFDDTRVTIREQAVLQIPLFKAADFASFIAKETIVGYDVSEPVRIDSLDTLTFAYTSATTSQSNIANEDSLTFKIVGVPKIVWTYDVKQLVSDLQGKEKTAFTGALGKYPGIQRGEVVLRPFWARSFPENEAKITVTESLSTPNP